TGLFTSVFLNKVGNSGDININAKSVTVENGAQLNASTYGTGDAGNINITASDFVLFSGANAIAATNVGGSVFPGALTAQPVGSIGNTGTAIGDGGNIIIDAPSVSVKDGAQLQAFTFGKGNAGSININNNININAANSVLFSGKDNIGILSGAYSTVGFVNVLNAIGDAGNINIKANSLSVTDGAVLINSTWGKGNAGDITINASDSILLSGSGNGFNGISSFVNQSAIGNGGNIKVTARTLEMLNGSQISTSTASSGNAGNINLFLTQSLLLDGSGTSIQSGTADVLGSTGNGGSIFIDPQNVTLQNGAAIFVSSFGTGIGGDIDISSNNLSLLNGAFIKAESYSANGGNITLNIPDLLLMRYVSSISATAGTLSDSSAIGNGGKITIDTGFIFGVSTENSDIYANGYFGNGGILNIATNNIFGLKYRPALTPLSDIVASSQFGLQGSVSINTTGVDPSKGLNNLPTDTRDASRLLANACIADKRGSSFTITGKGGIAAKPSDRPSPNALDNLGTISTQTANLTTSPNVSAPTGDRIVEATGWMRNAQNQIVLIAGDTPSQTKIACP
ncbi:MAG: S-layer family protein, partial [Pseudanabaena sp. ELA748]